MPDELPHDYVLKVAKPYLGKFISKSSDWTPLRDRRSAFKGYNRDNLDLRDPWQFRNFLVTASD